MPQVNRTIRLPRIEMGSTSTNRKTEMRLSKQSLVVPRQNRSRVRDVGMNGSVVGRGSRRYERTNLESGRYQSLSVDLGESKPL